MRLVAAIRRRIWKDKEVGELARDVSDALAQINGVEFRQFVDIYKEPMFIGVTEEPLEIRAARVLNDDTPDAPLPVGNVHFTYLGAGKGARINRIDWLTTGIKYRFTLAVTYA